VNNFSLCPLLNCRFAQSVQDLLRTEDALAAMAWDGSGEGAGWPLVPQRQHGSSSGSGRRAPETAGGESQRQQSLGQDSGDGAAMESTSMIRPQQPRPGGVAVSFAAATRKKTVRTLFLAL
jgi:hypothetical protein